MKKYIVIIIFAVMAIGVTSCKKDNTNKPVNQEDELMARSKKVISLIKDFDWKINSNLKSGEVMGIDSAVWYLEALQNFEYANPGEATKEFKTVKSNYTLDLDANGIALFSDVQAVYAQMEETLTLQLSQIPGDEKVVHFSDVALDSIEGSTAYLSTTLGFGYTWLLNMYWPFNTSDNWYWGTLGQEYGNTLLGKCDGTQYGVSDASDELQWRLNNPVVAPANPYKLISLQTEYTDGTSYIGPNGEPRLYVGWDYPEDNCLTHDMLTNYLLQSHYIINDYAEGVRPPGKAFANVEIHDWILLGGAFPEHFHQYYVTYGTRVYVGPSY